MNRSGIILFILLLLISCSGEHHSDAPVASVTDSKPIQQQTNADTAFLNQEKSEIAWKGTKMWGRGMHTGIVPIKTGFLLFRNDSLSGGNMTVDMTAIGITDIPPDQPEPIKVLTGHLEDEVFFDVENYSMASFSFTDVNYLSGCKLQIEGNLTIRDITKQITIPARLDSSEQFYTSRFRFNRFDFGIAYDGGFGSSYFAARNFVDKYIELTIRLVPLH